MNAESYIALAAALVVRGFIEKDGGNYFCQDLPDMDIQHFLSVLGEPSSDLTKVSLALVGYDPTETDLQDQLDSIGLNPERVTTDIYVAAKWRNQTETHTNIVVLAHGHHPGANTLAHFQQCTPKDFSTKLLNWAYDSSSLASRPAQKELLNVLGKNNKLSTLTSLHGFANFLATWEEKQGKDKSDAPRKALPCLGLFPDRNLFMNTKEIADRLLKNSKLFEKISLLPDKRLDEIGKKLLTSNVREQQKKSETIEKIRLMLEPGRKLDIEKWPDFDDVNQLFGTKGIKPPRPSPRPDLASDVGRSLLDGDDVKLASLADAVRSAISNASQDDEDEYLVEYEKDGEQFKYEGNLDKELLTRIDFFCNSESWGGYFQTPNIELESAFRDYEQCEPILFQPTSETIPYQGEKYDLRCVIEKMQEALVKQGINENFCEMWDRIAALRNNVLNDIEFLVLQPMIALASKSDLRKTVGELIQQWERFYKKLDQHHDSMRNYDTGWTRMLFEAVAALDVIQIKTLLDEEKISWKAVLLPTHPLHLWRYEKMGKVAHGLGHDEKDRNAILEQLAKPEQYLGVLGLTSFPEGKGGNQTLPISRDFRGLAVFENLRNAYSGNDGIKDLEICVKRFAAVYGNHSQPIRLALVNPPNASDTLLALLKDTESTRLKIDVYATKGHESRLFTARRFSTENRDLMEEHIKSGRIRLYIHDSATSLDELLGTLRDRPVHIVAVFDEASTAMRNQKGGINILHMSPFAIRKRIEFRGINGQIELSPSIEETVFRSFNNIQERLNSELSHTPQASADAENMLSHIENTIATKPSPGAFWFFFADRALPSPNRTSVARLFEKRNGRRFTVCYDSSYKRLALLLRLPLDNFNLTFSVNELQKLIEESINLNGNGIFDLFESSMVPNKSAVLGFAGMLIAARDYKSRHPEALLVSVDSQLARSWLRWSNTNKRCDLLGLRNVDGKKIVEVIEVKTTGSEAVSQTEIFEAKEQIEKTLEAVQSGLSENLESSPLAAPRQEMLKEVFVSGCQAQEATKEDRERWCEWLKALFRESESIGETEALGVIYAIELSINSSITNQKFKDDPSITLRRIGEEAIQGLLSNEAVSSSEAADLDPQIIEEPSKPSAADLGPQITEEPSKPVAAHSDSPNINDTASGSINVAPEKISSSATPDSQSENLGIRFAVGNHLRKTTESYFFYPSNTKLNQLNIGVVGDLGTGKTQLTKALIYNLREGARENRNKAPKFLIFDYKRDYTKPEFVEAVNAKVVSPPHIPLNIFDLSIGSDHPRQAQLGRARFLTDALDKIYSGIGPVQQNNIKEAVLEGYKTTQDGFPTLVDILKVYKKRQGGKVDAPYSILSNFTDSEIFVERAKDAMHFNEFFSDVTVVDLAAQGVGDKERNMLVTLFLNLYYEYMMCLKKHPYTGNDPQLRFIDSMLLIDEADNIMKYNFDVLRNILLQGREFGVGVLLASQFLSHFRTSKTDYSEPLLTWFVHKVPNVKPRELESIGLTKVSPSTVDQIKGLDVHECLYKTFDVPGRFMRTLPFYSIRNTD